MKKITGNKAYKIIGEAFGKRGRDFFLNQKRQGNEVTLVPSKLGGFYIKLKGEK